jgi:hypothetical protein
MILSTACKGRSPAGYVVCYEDSHPMTMVTAFTESAYFNLPTLQAIVSLADPCGIWIASRRASVATPSAKRLPVPTRRHCLTARNFWPSRHGRPPLRGDSLEADASDTANGVPARRGTENVSHM